MPEITHIEIDKVSEAVKWLNSEQSSADENSVRELLNGMTHSFRQRYRNAHDGSEPLRVLSVEPHPLSITAVGGIDPLGIMNDVKGIPEKPEWETITASEASADGKSKERTRQVDSSMLIDSIAHVCQSAGFSPTLARTQLILYCLYGSLLAHQGQRLNIEHPQMWRYGPVFPAAYRRNNLKDRRLCYESFRELSRQESDLAVKLTDKTRSMMSTPMYDLNLMHRGRKSPYGQVLLKNPNKWGTEIPDDMIQAFFSAGLPGYM